MSEFIATTLKKGNKLLYPTTYYNQIIMPDGTRWNGIFTTPDTTEILPIIKGGTGANNIDNARQNITNLGSNLITTPANDTVANWGSHLGLGFSMYTADGQLNNQPSQYGLLLNIGQHASEVHQLWLTQPQGNIYHRGGNDSGWTNESWVTLLDSNNYNTYAPKKDGTGATGTWGISISGTAAKATTLAAARTFQIADNDATNKGPTASFNGSANVIINLPSSIKASLSGNANTASQLNAYSTPGEYTKNTLAYFNSPIGHNGTAQAGINDGPVLNTDTWWHFLRFTHSNSNGYYTDLAIPFNDNSIFYKRISSGQVANSTTNAGWVQVLDVLNYHHYALPLSGGQLSGPIHISHYTTADMSTSTTNPRIIFSEGGTQPVALVYSNYDNYRGPHGLKVIGLDGGKSWFEVDGPIYANGGVVGNSDSATLSWHLKQSLPSKHSEFQAITYTTGQYAIGTGPDQVQKNTSSGDRLVISSSDKVVYDNGSVSNVQFLRFYWGSTYWNELHMSPNNNKLMWRMVQNGNPSDFQQIWKEGDSVTGAVWNDYAEYRESDCKEYGRVLVENGDDTLSISTKRLQPFAGVSSDTWGFCQGETEKAKTPIAVAGRVLVYPYRDRNEYKPGDVVCTAPNGTVDIMTPQEEMMYPSRIVGTVSCVPDYEEWGNGDREPAKVNGRIWIKVK